MKLRLKKRWRAPQAKEKTNVGTAQMPAATPATQNNQASPRALGNPYGRLFTQDKSFADLLASAQHTPHAQSATLTDAQTGAQTGALADAQTNPQQREPHDNATPDRVVNTALTAPEKHPE